MNISKEDATSVSAQLAHVNDYLSTIVTELELLEDCYARLATDFLAISEIVSGQSNEQSTILMNPPAVDVIGNRITPDLRGE